MYQLLVYRNYFCNISCFFYLTLGMQSSKEQANSLLAHNDMFLVSQYNSSDPSAHCGCPSHLLDIGKQFLPMGQKISLAALQTWHPDSSEPSSQSATPLQNKSDDMQWPLEHLNSVTSHVVGSEINVYYKQFYDIRNVNLQHT